MALPPARFREPLPPAQRRSDRVQCADLDQVDAQRRARTASASNSPPAPAIAIAVSVSMPRRDLLDPANAETLYRPHVAELTLR